MIKVRTATKKEWKQIDKMARDFRREYVKTDYGMHKQTSARSKAQCEAGFFKFIIVNNVIVGYFNGQYVPDMLAQIDCVYIKPFHRGKGYSSEFYKFITSTCSVSMSISAYRLYELADYFTSVGFNGFGMTENDGFGPLGLMKVGNAGMPVPLTEDLVLKAAWQHMENENVDMTDFDKNYGEHVSKIAGTKMNMKLREAA